MTLYSIPSTLSTIFIVGYVADIIRPVYMIVPAFLGRSIVCYSFQFVEDPESPAAYFSACMLLACSTMMVVSIESLFMKNLPREVRGAMTILLTFFMGLGALLFNGIGGPVFDSMGPSSPFVLVSILDTVFCIFALLLGCCGYLTTAEEDQKALAKRELGQAKRSEGSNDARQADGISLEGATPRKNNH